MVASYTARMALIQPQSRVEKTLQGVLVMFVLGATALSVWHFVGPYRWLVQMQLALFGRYDVRLTSLLTFMVMWLPLAMATQLVARRWQHRSTPPAIDSRRSTIPPHFMRSFRSDTHAQADRRTGSEWLYDQLFRTWGGYLTMIGVIALALGGLAHQRFSSMHGPVATTLQQLEAGVAPSSGWLAVSGIGLPQYAVDVTTHSVVTFTYVPIVHDPTAMPRSIAVYAKVPERISFGWPATGQVLEGVKDIEGLPGPAILEFERLGLPPASNCIVLEVGHTPQQGQGASRLILAIGGVILSLGIVVMASSSLMKRRRGPS